MRFDRIYLNIGEMTLPASSSASSPWQNVPRKSIVIFFVAVFFTFLTLGFVNDIGGMGRQPTIRFAMGVLLSGCFPVLYAGFGITLRGKFWIAFVPLLALHVFLMSLLVTLFPDPPHPAQLSAIETLRLQQRLTFDCLATAAAVFLGYAGFVFVFVSESRRHIQVRTEKAMLETEMAAAREIQRLILPDHSEPFRNFAVDTAYQPAQQVGGDFFQVLPDGGGGLLVVIGDVAGKGLPAAMLVSMLVGSIRTAAEDGKDPAVMLSRLHERLIGRTGTGFSTALAARISRNGEVSIANAGHLPPYLDGQELELPGALPLGIPGGGQYPITDFELAPGSRLTFYTDGVAEARSATGELFGFDRAKAIAMLSAASIVEAAAHFGQSDDITVVTITRRSALD